MFAMYRHAMRIDSRPMGSPCPSPVSGAVRRRRYGFDAGFFTISLPSAWQLEQLEQSSRLVPGGSNMARMVRRRHRRVSQYALMASSRESMSCAALMREGSPDSSARLFASHAAWRSHRQSPGLQ